MKISPWSSNDLPRHVYFRLAFVAFGFDLVLLFVLVYVCVYTLGLNQNMKLIRRFSIPYVRVAY